MSNDQEKAALRLGGGVVTVVADTSNVAKVFSFQVLLPAQETGLRADSKAQAEQVRSVAVQPVGQTVRRVPLHLITDVDDAPRLHLQL